MLGDRLYVTPHSTLHVFQTLLPSIFPLFQRFSVVFFLPFFCHSSIFLHFLPFFNDFPSFFSYLFPVIPPFSSIFPPFSTIFLPFLSFCSYLFPGIPPFSPCFQRCSLFFPTFFLSFLHFPPFSPCFQRFSFTFLRFFFPFPAGPRGNRSLPSPLCVVVHAPKKSSIWPPSTATNFEILVPYATTTPQTP